MVKYRLPKTHFIEQSAETRGIALLNTPDQALKFELLKKSKVPLLSVKTILPINHNQMVQCCLHV